MHCSVLFLPILAIPIAFHTLGCEATPQQKSSTALGSPTDFVKTNKQEEAAATQLDIVEVYQELWPLIPIEQQHKKLPSLLTNDLPDLRSFGIKRVSILNRDGEATEAELLSIVTLLGDPNPKVRVAAAEMLPEISLPQVPVTVARYLASEMNEEVVLAEITYFITNPHPDAAQPVIAWLNSPLVQQSSEALVAIFTDTRLFGQVDELWIDAVKQAQQTYSEPALLTLEIIVGSDTNRQQCKELLARASDANRRAVATGFAAIGAWEPLLPYKNDTELSPFLIDALQVKGDLDSFEMLLTLKASIETGVWSNASVQILKNLDTRSLLLADNMLLQANETELRLNTLLAIWKQSENRSLAARIAIAKRAIPLLNDAGRSDEALQILEEYGDSIIDDELLTLQFDTAILASLWDSAADVRPEPAPWVQAWVSMKENDPPSAVVLRQQILQRFETTLTNEQQTLLGVEETSVVSEETTSKQEIIP